MFMDIYILTLIWCRFISISQRDRHCMIQEGRVSNDWLDMSDRQKNYFKNTTGQFHDAKINKTTPTQLGIIRLFPVGLQKFCSMFLQFFINIQTFF